MSLSGVADSMTEFERRFPGPTPSGGAYGIVRYLDANGKRTNAADAVTIELSEYAADHSLISVTAAVLGTDESAEDSR
jgi:hypothetical protein